MDEKLAKWQTHSFCVCLWEGRSKKYASCEKNLIETLSHMPIQHKTIFIQNNKHAKGRAYYELRMQKSDWCKNMKFCETSIFCIFSWKQLCIIKSNWIVIFSKRIIHRNQMKTDNTISFKRCVELNL